jgi:hypothetical protein
MKLLLRFSGMVYFSQKKVILIKLILLSYPKLYRDQLKYMERKLLFDLLRMPAAMNFLICPSEFGCICCFLQYL